MKTNKKVRPVKSVKGDEKPFNRVYIIKASGKRELFDGAKIYNTAKNAGADKILAEGAKREVEKKIYSNISSNEILNYTLDYLDRQEKRVAIRYSLKRAIMELGPCGYSFEKYVAMILKEYGYQIKINQFIKGYCLTYEIDILAEKGNKVFVVECKYHNSPGTHSDTKVVLYSNARFLDIKKHWQEKMNKDCQPCKALLVTNTKCTANAVKYAECVEMDIISWHYPKEKSLENLIEQKKLYPITCLPFLKRENRNRLIVNNVILLKDLLNLDLEKMAKKSGIFLKELRKLRNQAEKMY